MSTASDEANTLYALPPKAFTAARDERVAAARNAGDRALASELGAFKRPTVGAWLVNLVALRQPDTVESLVSLGQAIRDAQGVVSATELRELSTRRRAELDAALALVRRLASDAGETATPAQISEAEGTLAAAMADPEAAEQVRGGRLLKPLTYSGFGGGTFGSSAPATGSARSAPARRPSSAAASRSPGAPTPSAVDTDAQARSDAAARAEATARIEAAQRQVDSATAALDEAVEAEQDLRRQGEDLTNQIAALSEQLDRLNREVRTARQARLAAERDLAAAERRLARVSPS